MLASSPSLPFCFDNQVNGESTIGTPSYDDSSRRGVKHARKLHLHHNVLLAQRVQLPVPQIIDFVEVVKAFPWSTFPGASWRRDLTSRSVDLLLPQKSTPGRRCTEQMLTVPRADGCDQLVDDPSWRMRSPRSGRIPSQWMPQLEANGEALQGWVAAAPTHQLQ